MQQGAASAATASCLLIIDGHAYAYRAFHAIRRLSAPSGAPTNAIYGFIKMTGRLQTLLGPTHLAVVWDGGLAAERMADLPEYKQQRPPMPSDLEPQIVAIQQWLNAAGIASVSEEGVEADDTIASLAKRGAAEGLAVVIASSDKDFMQLVGPRIGLYNPNDKSEKVWGRAEVVAKAGVAPEQVVDWLSLVGDSVDNIPGVPGVGQKTAAELLQRFGSIEALSARLEEVKSARVRAALEASAEAVRRNQRLIRLKTDLAVEPLDRFVPRRSNDDTLRGLYAAWGFKTMLTELSAPSPVQSELL